MTNFMTDTEKQLEKYKNLAAYLVDVLLDDRDSCQCNTRHYRNSVCPRCAAIEKYKQLTVLD
jgi:hypothetical protein